MTRTAAASARVRLSSRAAPAPPAPEGWRLGPLLGEGRWSQVFRASPRDCPDDHPGDYALKLLKAEFNSSPECVAMLRCEAALAREVAHPHLVAVLGAHWKQAPFFLTLPYLEGCTLAAALAQSRVLPVSFALWLARQAAEPLAALHQAGWLHGDIKPENLHVAPTGHVTVLDLGLAQPLSAATAPCNRPFAGSVAYAAPETFCSAQPLTGAADVYSLGMLLFESLTGRPPFEAASADEVAAAHLSAPPPDVRTLAPHVPGRLARVVLRMLAKNPLRRPTSAECVELLAALEIETFGEGAALAEVVSSPAD